jgi:hypothetical protein
VANTEWPAGRKRVIGLQSLRPSFRTAIAFTSDMGASMNFSPTVSYCAWRNLLVGGYDYASARVGFNFAGSANVGQRCSGERTFYTPQTAITVSQAE